MGSATPKMMPIAIGIKIMRIGEAVYFQRVPMIRYLSIAMPVNKTRDIDLPLKSIAE
jgi:hypothetical protein